MVVAGPGVSSLGWAGGGGVDPPRANQMAAVGRMLALFTKLLDWFRALYQREEMELSLVELLYSGKMRNFMQITPAGKKS
ncbi:unnamed protein product [Caretta caretta]